MANNVRFNVYFKQINDAAKAKLKEMFERVRKDTDHKWIGDIYVDGKAGSPTYEEIVKYSWTTDNIGPKWCYFEDYDADSFTGESAWEPPTKAIEWILGQLEEFDSKLIAVYTYEDENPDFTGVFVYEGSKCIDGNEEDIVEEEIFKRAIAAHPDELDGKYDFDKEEWIDEDAEEIYREVFWEVINDAQEKLAHEIIDTWKKKEDSVEQTDENLTEAQKDKYWNSLDENWERILSKILKEKNIPKSEFQEIFKLQEIDLESEGIKILEPLREFKNLTGLNCFNNKITDLEPLRGLKNLEELDISFNEITDLEPLRELHNLTDLSCSGNKITDLEPLRELHNLTVLYCSNTQITDLEPLRELYNLTELSCSDNEITDLEPLRNLHNLTKLKCDNIKISDVVLLLPDITSLPEEALVLEKKIKEIPSSVRYHLDLIKSFENIDFIGKKEWMIGLLKKTEKLAEDSEDYGRIADIVAHSASLGDVNWARKLCLKSLELVSKSSSPFFKKVGIANFITSDRGLSDKSWGKEIYKDAEKTADSTHKLRYLAESVAKDETIGDKNWAKKLYKEALANAKTSREFSILASDGERTDKNTVKDLYIKAEEHAESYDDYQILAYDIAKDDYIEDKDWAREVFCKAEELAESYQIYVLADYILWGLGDKDWAIKLYKQAEKVLLTNPETSHEYIIWFAKSLAENLKDEIWAERTNLVAEIYFTSEEDEDSYLTSLKKKNLASDPDICIEVLDKLIVDNYRWVREMAVSNNKIDQSRINELIKTGDRYILKGLLKNENIEKQDKQTILDILKDEDKYPVETDTYIIGTDDFASFIEAAAGSVSLDDLVSAVMDGAENWMEYVNFPIDSEDYSGFYFLFGTDEPATTVQLPDGTKEEIKIKIDQKEFEKPDIKDYCEGYANGDLISDGWSDWGTKRGWDEFNKYTVELEYDFDVNNINVVMDNGIVSQYLYIENDIEKDFEDDDGRTVECYDVLCSLYVIIDGELNEIYLEDIREEMRSEDLDPEEENDVKKYLNEKYKCK